MKKMLNCLLILAVLAAIALGLSGCATEPEEASGPGYILLSPAQLDELLQEKDFLLVNVHIPYEGEIDQTDLFIPYNEIEQNLDKLPADKDAKIVLYCRSGSMSATASRALVDLGYSNVWDLSGGWIAWEKEGYPLLHNPR